MLRSIWLSIVGVFILVSLMPDIDGIEHGSTHQNIKVSQVVFDPTLVKVTQGQVRGVKEEALNGKEFYSFRGIPFAKPPLGDLRFQPPQDADKWDGVLEADTDPPACAQLNMVAFAAHGRSEFIGSEDCLYLNVFSPMPQQVDDTSLLPVMVFIHGGGYECGSASLYQPYALMTKDIVLVVIQYRLSSLGFLSTEDDEAPGNMGILDQTAALSWVQKNAPGFRGNPLQITIFGESAGGASVHFHLLSPASLGLFHRAILQSGNAITPWSYWTNHRKYAYQMAKQLNCGTSSKVETPDQCEVDEENPMQYESCVVDQLPSSVVLECLRQAPIQQLVELSWKFPKVGLCPLVMSPRVDEVTLMKDPMHLVKEGRSQKVDIMLGVTKDEGSLLTEPLFFDGEKRSALRSKFEEMAPVLLGFGEGDQAPVSQSISIFDFYVGNTDFDIESLDNHIAMVGDRLMWYPTDSLAHYLARDDEAAREGKKLYVYQFDYLTDTHREGFFGHKGGKRYVSHAEDLVYLFDTPHGHLWFPSPLVTEDDIAVRNSMVEMWTNFARTGNPTPDNELTPWLPYTEDTPRIMHINRDCHTEDVDTKKEIRDFWRKLPLKLNLVLFPETVDNLELFDTSDEASGAKTQQKTSFDGPGNTKNEL